MTHEEFVREARAALRPEDLRYAWAATFTSVLHRPAHVVTHAVTVWEPRQRRYSSDACETDDAIRAGLAAFAEQLGGPRADDLIGKGV